MIRRTQVNIQDHLVIQDFITFWTSIRGGENTKTYIKVSMALFWQSLSRSEGDHSLEVMK